MSRTSLPSLNVCSTIARSDVISCSLMAKSTSSIISGRSMSKSDRRLLLLLSDDDVMDEEEDSGDVMDKGDDDIRLRGQMGEVAKFCANELSADDGSHGDIIGS